MERGVFMPRTARKKAQKLPYHVYGRSISEVALYKNDKDKLKFISIIKKYQILYKFRIYGYCLMDTHYHLIIDANGADISEIMHSINFVYALYFNKRHKRHGHLFQDRFKSKIVENNEYLLALSAYVHNNATDIPGYENRPEEYAFSSLGVYLGLKHDPYEMVEDDLIMGLFNKVPKFARKNYLSFVYKCDDKKFKEEVEFQNEKTEYRSERKILVRDYKEEDIVEFISSKMDVPKAKLYAKHCREIVNAKALLVVLMRSLCNYKCNTICKILGNITQSRVSSLSSFGINLIDTDERFRNIFEEFISSHAIKKIS